MDSHFYLVSIPDAPICLARIATSGQMFRWSQTEGGWRVIDGNHWFDIVPIGDTLFEVTSNQPESAFRSLFRLETDHDNLQKELVRLGPEIEPFLAQRHGLRMLRPHSKVEVLFSFLCSSCNHIARITTMVHSLANISTEGFPTIEQCAEVTESELRSQGFGYRGATIPKVAQILHANGGEKYLYDLASGSYADARRELIELPGVGKKIADCICLYAFDFGEAVPVDTHIWQILTRVYFPQWQDVRFNPSKYEVVAGHLQDRFGKLAGVAQQFFFVDNMERYRER